MKRVKPRMSMLLRALLFAGAIQLMTGAILYAASAEHVVQPGETLSQIAVDYDVSIADLLQANGLGNANFVRVGQTLTIPSEDELQVEAVADQTSSQVDGTLDLLQSEMELAAEAEASDFEETEETTALEYVTVRPGETLSQIALRYGMSSRSLMALNGLSNPNFVYVGQQLRVADESGNVTSMEDMLPTWQTSEIHEVQFGESLGQIAELYGVKFSILVRYNDLQGNYEIHPGQQLRIPEMPHLTLADVDYSNAPPAGKRLLEVDLSGQWMTAWEGKKVVMHTLISSGTPDTPTVLGRYSIYRKVDKQDMNGFSGPLPDVPWVMYFYDGFAFHGAYWHTSFGIPMSHGCVHLTPAQAKELYDWADIGTEVYVHW